MVSNQENRMKSILDIILPQQKYLDNYRPNWLMNPQTGHNLELDRFYPDLNIAFEFNSFTHKKKNDEAQWKRDRIKKNLCAKNKISLLIVKPSELSILKIREKLQDLKNMKESWADGKSWSKSN